MRRRVAVATVRPPDVKWAYEGTDALSVESRYANPCKVLVQCVDGQWFEIRNLGVQEGRLPSPQEYDMGTPVAVIGEETKYHFFPGISPIGRGIRIANNPFTVTGGAREEGRVNRRVP